MKKTDENGHRAKRVNRRSDENVVENNARISLNSQSETRNNIPENPTDSTSLFTFSGLRGGVTDFLRRIHWQPNSNTILEDSNNNNSRRVGRGSRQLIQEEGSGSGTRIKSKGSKTTTKNTSSKIIKANKTKTKANELETENIEKEARRLKRRRRSSRTTKSHERQDGDVDYFSGRHLEEQGRSTRRGNHHERQENDKKTHSSEEEEETHLQNCFPYGGDTGTRERNHQKKRGRAPPLSETQTSEGEIISISTTTDLGKIISEGEIPSSIPQKPSEGEVIVEPNKFKFPPEILPPAKTTTIVSKNANKRKKKLRQPQKRSPPRLVLRTKPKPTQSGSVKAVNADEEGVRRSRRDKYEILPPSSGSGTSPHTKTQKPRKHLAKNISNGIPGHEETNSPTRVSSAELKLKPDPDSERSEFHEISGYTCSDGSYKTIKSLEFYLRTPSQILAESQSRASSRSRARNRNRIRTRTRTRPSNLDRTGVMNRRSHPSPPSTPNPLRVTLVPFHPPQVGLESRNRTPSRFRYSPPPTPPPRLIFEDAETIRRKLEGYSTSTTTTTTTTTSSITSSYTKLKSGSVTLVDLLKKLVLHLGRGGKGVHRAFDPEAEERIKIAKKNKGPLWRVEFFDRNRADNKLRNKKYALMFDLGYKKSKFRKKDVKLMDNFLHFAKEKRRKLFKKNKYGKKKQRKGRRRGEESLRLRSHDHGKGGNYPRRRGRMAYKNNTNVNDNNHVDPKMEYINHVLTRPIAFDKAPMDEDAFNIEPPKVLDFSHLIKPSSHHYHQGPDIPHEFSISRDKDSWQDYVEPNNNHDEHRHRSLTTITQKRRSSYSRNYSLASLTPLLEDSSKVSEKTLVLLQASRVTSSSQLHFPMNSSLSSPNQFGRKSTGELFDPNTLAKIYTPKTDFTRQFASLLPSYNKDAHFSSDFRHF